MSIASKEAETSALAFELRLELLEALVGIRAPGIKLGKTNESIARRAHNIVTGVNDAINCATSEAVKHFIENCKIFLALF